MIIADAEEVKQREAQQVEFHLAILGPRQSYQATAKNYTTNDVENTYLKKEEVLSWCLDLNQKGYVAWLSINDKEKDCKEGVTALNDFWLEIDARPKGVDDRTATEQELLTALDRANKLQNPRLMQIHFHTLRHWKATMEYHKTRDILHVMNLLGHRNIESTLVYTQLISFESDEFHSAVAKTVDEARKLLEDGFDYVCQKDDIMLFRKRK